MRRLLIVLLFLIPASYAAGQTCYFPIAQGTVWDYGGLFRQWRAIGDTILEDTHHYAVLQDSWYHQQKYLRQQGDTVYQGSMLLYDFTRSAGDTLWVTTGGSSSTANVLVRRGDTTMFGRHLRYWMFRRSTHDTLGGGFSGELIVDSLGMTYQAEAFEFAVEPWVLQGAIIDGRQYGLVAAIGGGAAQGLPAAVSLHQNYPNPFNPTTVITFEVPTATEARLEVFDVLGRPVAILVSGRRAAGVHTVEFDGSKCGSGVYLCRLKVGGVLLTRKMVLVR